MASTFFGLHIGSSALSSFQVATNTTANNIANVKTTGYTRQEATLQAKDAIKCHSPLRKRRHRCYSHLNQTAA